MNGVAPHPFTAAEIPESSSTNPPMPRLPAVMATRSPGRTRLAIPHVVSLSRTSSATRSTWSVGSCWRTRAIGGRLRRGNATALTLDNFTNAILHDRLDDSPGVFLAARQRFRELESLVRADPARHRRLVWIDDRLD